MTAIEMRPFLPNVAFQMLSFLLNSSSLRCKQANHNAQSLERATQFVSNFLENFGRAMGALSFSGCGNSVTLQSTRSLNAAAKRSSSLMTLCLAWKLGKNVWLASDSRLSIGSDKPPFFDYGIKVCSMPVEVVSIADQGAEPEVIFKAEFGLVFSGNMTAAYILREMLANVLGRLQYSVPEVPIEAIVKVVLAFYRHYLEKLFPVFHRSGDYRFILAGRCGVSQKIRVFKFEFSPEARANEILLTPPFSYDCIGSGEDHFRKLASVQIDGQTKDLDKKMFRALRQVINDPTATDVGGLIQTGTFDDGNFRIFAVLLHDLSGETPKAIQAVGGLSLEDVYHLETLNDLHIRSKLKAPFQDDLQHLP